ncbi:hypothetical protein HRbin15_02377 [bacterium HR15]|nr:hypothetical protein HRbin15_02377 [bacterium HR15]
MEKREPSLADWLGRMEYAILDGAQSAEIAARCAQLTREECLPLWEMSDEAAAELAPVAPYLVRLAADPTLTDWLIQEGWGKQWGIFLSLRLPTTLEQLKRHFQPFLLAQVEGEEDKSFYFRFYDPRVFRTFMDICTPEQAQSFFGPVKQFLTEGTTSTQLHLYSLIRGQVKHEIVQATSGNHPD